MRLWKNLGVAATILFASVAVSTARADFLLVSQAVTLDRPDKTLDFSLTFNQPPNFSVFDQLGRPANSFQVEFNGSYSIGQTLTPSDLTAVIRGDEIHFGDGLRIREATGDGGPSAGGWGPLVGTVPFKLVDDTVSFTAPLNELGWSGNYYQARIISLEYGKQTAEQIVTMVPTPSAFPAGVAGLIVVAGISMRMRRGKSSAA